MERDPFAFVSDAPLFVVPRMLAQLRAYRDDVPLPELARLAERLLAGIEAHPTRFWVLKQVQRSLEAMREEDVNTRKRCATEIEGLMAIVGISSSVGLVSYYLGGI